MYRKLKVLFIFLIIIYSLLTFSFNALATTTSTGDEQATFGSLAPDVFIVLDISNSMLNNSNNDSNIYGADTTCMADTSKCTGGNCSGGFCQTSSTACSYDCRRISMAKRAIFSILDYDKDGYITKADSDKLNIRIGGMSFYGNNVFTQVGTLGDTYQKIMCGSKTSSNTCNDLKVASNSCYTDPCFAGQNASSSTTGTPLANALDNAKNFYDNFADTAKACRKKFVILITDGMDTVACGGSASSDEYCNDTSYKRRRESVLKAKALADAGYKLYVIGFGGLPDYLKNTLNWMAFWGDPANKNNTTPTYFNPNSVSSCQDDSIFKPENNCSSSTGNVSIDNFYANSNDPGNIGLSGYALLTSESTTLTQNLMNTISAISSSTYSFTQASVQAVRDDQESYLYEASFNYSDTDPLWIGHLKKFEIYKSGDINPVAIWDAGSILQGADPNKRQINTYKRNSTGTGSQITFEAGVSTDTGKVTMYDLSVNNDSEATAVVSFIRKGETDSSYTYNGWKLGDVFHASPLSIGTPNGLFYDQYDSNTDPTQKAFNKYRQNHIRSSTDGTRLILLGANDGQLHLFKSQDGTEVWSFVPPNLLPKLKYIAHKEGTHPPKSIVTSDTNGTISGIPLGHQYFVDGPVSAAEVWFDSKDTPSDLCNGTTCGVSKSDGEWHTYFVLSEGRGGNTTLWSSSTFCDNGDFKPLYNATSTLATTSTPAIPAYTNYCGYYAFDISDTAGISAGTSKPEFKWRIGANSGLDPKNGMHLGQPWSKMFIGRVRIDNKEKWVGLIGGGYSGTACGNASGRVCSDAEAPGKGFFVVDMKTGAILWSATHNAVDASGNSSVAHANMDYDLAAPAVGIDTDNDGFMDAAYVPDTGGNVWRFKFCTRAQDADQSCGISSWSASELFHNSSGVITPIFTSVAAAMDPNKQLWVYFGTGDKTEPAAANAQENFVAIKEDLSTTFTYSDLDNIGSETQTGVYGGTKKGWYINFTGSGEKMLGDPVVFEGVVYFTSYKPATTNDPCNTNGTSKVYGVNYTTGAGVFSGGQKGEDIGGGLSTGVTISRGDSGTDVYVSKSTGEPHTVEVPNIPLSNAAKNSIIYWRDLRVQ